MCNCQLWLRGVRVIQAFVGRLALRCPGLSAVVRLGLWQKAGLQVGLFKKQKGCMYFSLYQIEGWGYGGPPCSNAGQDWLLTTVRLLLIRSCYWAISERLDGAGIGKRVVNVAHTRWWWAEAGLFLLVLLLQLSPSFPDMSGITFSWL